MPNRMLTKLAAKLLWFTLVFCPAVSVATGCAAAQTPVPGSDYARLQNLTSQLQTSPANDALRKQIIALALKLPTPPNETSAAIEAQGAGKYAFHHAQSAVDFYNAGQAFDHAALLAPWMAANYYNAAQAYAKTAHLNRAIADLRWYLKAAPNAEDKDAVLEQIGGLKYAQQHPVSRHTTTPTAAATAAQAQAAVAQAALARYLGNWQVRQATLSGRSVSCMWTLTITKSSEAWSLGGGLCSNGDHNVLDSISGNGLKFRNQMVNDGGRLVQEQTYRLRISPDGNTMEGTMQLTFPVTGPIVDLNIERVP